MFHSGEILSCACRQIFQTGVVSRDVPTLVDTVRNHIKGEWEGTQRELSNLSGVPQNTLSMFVNRPDRGISSKYLLALCKVLDIDPATGEKRGSTAATVKQDPRTPVLLDFDVPEHMELSPIEALRVLTWRKGGREAHLKLAAEELKAFLRSHSRRRKADKDPTTRSIVQIAIDAIEAVLRSNQ